MHPALRTLLICIIIGLAFGSYFYFNYDHRPVRIFTSLLSSINIGILMMLVIQFRYYFTGSTSYQIGKVIIMIILLISAALLGSEITFLMRSLIWGDQQYVAFNGGSVYILNILIVLVTGIPIYVSEEWKSVLNSRILSQQYKLLQLEQQQTLFELELLRAKINPHFLYNVHNAIAGLISKDPVKAEQLVVLLSKFFRFTLNKNSATFHTVSDETDIISTYLAMQQIRFENRMTYTITAAPIVLNMQIPSFILQPLVENAVKHGIETSAANGFVTVQIIHSDKNIIITIADSGKAFSDTPGTGLGLQMVMNKLKLLYADDFSLELINTPQKYVRLTIPGRN